MHGLMIRLISCLCCIGCVLTVVSYEKVLLYHCISVSEMFIRIEKEVLFKMTNIEIYRLSKM